MTALAFDITERLQTPVIVMSDLDLGMNDHISEPLVWDDGTRYDRGKVLDSAALNSNGRFGRYKDLDGDGIPYRTIPATDLTHGAFTTRGSSHDEYARYTEDSAEYKKNVDRLLKKWETAKSLVPPPEFFEAGSRVGSPHVSKVSNLGLVFFGTSTYSSEEALELLELEGIKLDAMRVRGFPFSDTVAEFIDLHEKIFVIEQNRDAQFRSLMLIELDADPKKLIKVLNYDGTPITADNICRQIKGIAKA
jgi:2-oxoglutarate ferredoxin oxidoreductase subunit alpha